MDKKNTMLLTVIAVATLLVAVVGATFAYFAISTDEGANSKTTITGNTQEAQVGSVALKGNQNLAMKLTAEDMSKANQDNVFYANLDGTATMTAEQKLTVGTATLTGGSDNITYSCKAGYKITYEDKSANIEWQQGEAVLKLHGDANVTIQEEDATTTGYDLSTLKGQEAGQTVNVTFKLSSGDLGIKTADLKASLAIKNTTNEQQDRLANKEFTVNLQADSFECDTVAG